MATYSTYKNLEKPLSTEKYNVGVANKNVDIIDSEFHKLDLKNESQDNLLATKEALNTEIERATAKENTILQDLDAEISRAKSSENDLFDNIMNETDRASMSEVSIQESLFTHISDESNPHKVTPTQLNLENVDNTSDMDKPVSISQQNAIDDALYQSNYYTDTKIAELIDGAPETLDTIKEVAEAIQEHESVAEALNAAIGEKADAAEVNAHINNSYIHVTASEKEKIKDLDNINPLNAFYSSGNNQLDPLLSDIDFIKQHPYLFGHSDALNALGYWINVFSIKNGHYNQVSQIAVGENGMASRYYRHNTDTWSDWYRTATKNDIDTSKVIYSDSQPTSLSSGMTWIGN